MDTDIKILFTDLDFTLIKPKGGRKFPINSTDWEPLPESVKFIKGYLNKGYKLILVSNQAGIEKGFVKKVDIDKKLKDIESNLGIAFYKTFYESFFPNSKRKRSRIPIRNSWITSIPRSCNIIL